MVKKNYSCRSMLLLTRNLSFKSSQEHCVATAHVMRYAPQGDKMNRLKIITIVTTALLYLSLPISNAHGQQSMFDIEIPVEKVVRASLKTANRLTSKDGLTADEIRQIYFAEKQIGRCVWGVSERDSSLFGDQRIAAHNYYSDRKVTEQCLVYVQKNRGRFKIVGDGWKGENNFWEPTQYWAERAKKDHLNSVQALEIEFDLDFKIFIRRFYIDEEAKGKTCQQYHEEDVKNFLDAYLDVYTKEEIDQWPVECERVREEFIRGRSQLLERYRNAPFTKILQDIDPTTIVVMHSIC